VKITDLQGFLHYGCVIFVCFFPLSTLVFDTQMTRKMTRSTQGFSGGFLTGKKPQKAVENGLLAEPSNRLLFHPESKHFLKGYPGPENLADSLPATMSATWPSAEVRYVFLRKSEKKFSAFPFRFLAVFTGGRKMDFYPPIRPEKCLAVAPDLTRTYSTLKICAL